MICAFLTLQNVMAQIELPSYDKGLSIQAKDGSAKLKFSFRVQSLFTAEVEEGSNNPTYAMMIRRSRLKSDGYFLNKKFGYKFEMGLSNGDIGNGREIPESGNAPRLLLDGVLKYSPKPAWEVWFGQTKLPGNRERVISSQKLQFVDRSLVNSDFNIDRDFGVWVFYKKSIAKIPVILSGAISNGEGRDITVDNIGGFSYTGRFEFLPLGEFTKKGHYVSSDLEREKKPKVAIGVSYNYNQNASRQNGQLGSFVKDSNGYYLADLSNVMADLMFKFKGWSALAEYAQRTSTHDFATAPELSSFFDLGYGSNFQVGYLWKNNFEVAGRYTDIVAAESFTALKSRKQYTLGLSKYLSGHNLKWQTDLSYTKQATATKGDFMYRFQFEFGI